MAEQGLDLSKEELGFPDNVLGEISRDIVNLYFQIKDGDTYKSRLKRQLTQNIAHELKTPVSSIQGYMETIMTDSSMDEQTKMQFLTRCYAQSQRLSNLLADISLLTRMDDSTYPFEMSDVNLHSLIEEIKEDTLIQLKDKKMRLLNLTEENLPYEGNQPLLYSVFRNLTDNAIAYSGEGSIITIKLLKSNENEYVFSFSDNGVGVDNQHLPYLFDRFYRVDKGRSRKLGGTGLGLAIVKNAVILHGGSITAKKSNTGGLELVFSLRKA